MYIIRHPIVPPRNRVVPDRDGLDVAAERGMSEARLQDNLGSAMGTFVWWFGREADGEVKSRSKWKPTPADLAALKTAINTKAKHRIV